MIRTRTAGRFLGLVVLFSLMASAQEIIFENGFESVLTDGPAASFVQDKTSGDTPLLVNFTDTSSPGSASILTWAWDFGDPDSGAANTSALQNPSHTFNDAGTYTVFLTVTTTVDNDTITKVGLITVADAEAGPVTSFMADPILGLKPLQVNFADTSDPGSEAITSWAWDFGDPGSGNENTSVLQNPSHTYSTSGTYAVLLMVTTSIGNDASNQVNLITVSESEKLPTADFAPSATTAVAPLNIQFTDLSVPGSDPIIAWSWDFGDPGSGADNISGDQNPSHTYTSNGTFSVSLMVTTSAGADTETKSGFINVFVAPVFPTRLDSSSPGSGEGGIAVTRETILRFTRPLMPGTVGPSSIRAFSGASVLSTRLHVSPDEDVVTIFYTDPLPPNARISVEIDGNLLRDSSDNRVDGDNDNIAGGVGEIEFDTLALQPLPGTSVIGRVFASELGDGGTNTPLQGVHISVDGKESNLYADTDAQGNFLLDPAPAGRFFIHIDGRTATNVDIPAGAYYPFVGKAWEASPGQQTNIGDVFLPLVVDGTLQAVSTTTETPITFPAAILNAYPDLAGTGIIVPADSLFSDDGSRGGMVGIAPVPPDRLPGPLPLTLAAPLVITVQTDGATNFDIPVPIQFPNLAAPETGVPLPPGAKTGLWSFNHDSGRFEAVGGATVSEDGQFIVSDPGVGILAPGWHINIPGTPVRLNGANSPSSYIPSDPPCPCCDLAALEDNQRAKCATAPALMGIGELLPPPMGCAFGLGVGWVQTAFDCQHYATDLKCAEAFQSSTLGGLVGCIPIVGAIKGIDDNCLSGLEDAKAALKACKAANPGASLVMDLFSTTTTVALGTGGLSADQIALYEAAYDVYGFILGNTDWLNANTNESLSLLPPFFSALQTAVSVGSENGPIVSGAEFTVLQAMPLPGGISSADRGNLISRFESFMLGGMSEFQSSTDYQNAVTIYMDLAETLLGQGWQTTLDGFENAVDSTDSLSDSVATAAGIAEASLYYRLVNTFTGDTLRGRLSELGVFSGLALRGNAVYTVEYVHPETLEIGVTSFRTNDPGQLTSAPVTVMVASVEPDTDLDGLPDDVEVVIGTNPGDDDSDDDGVLDGAEIEQGTNPLDGILVQTGIVAAAATPNDARNVSADDAYVAVVDTTPSLLIFNTYNGMTPTVIAQIPLPYQPQAIAASANLLLLANGTNGLSFFDIADPTNPMLLGEIDAVSLGGGSVDTVAADGRRALVGTSGRVVSMLKLPSGNILRQAVYPRAVQGVALRGPLGVVLDSAELYTIEDIDNSAAFSGRIPVSGAPALGQDRRALFLGEDFAYVGERTRYHVVDVSNPTVPVEVSGPLASFNITFNAIAATASDDVLGITLTSLDGFGRHFVSHYDDSDHIDTEQFIVGFQLPTLDNLVSRELVLSNGLAYVPDGPAGLMVVNYIGVDLLGIPPSVSFTLDPATASAVEGENLDMLVSATDDVQLQNVELLLNGVVVQTDASYPYSFLVPVPSSTEGSVDLAVRAKDTGGNTTDSPTETITILADSTGPTVVTTVPLDGRIDFGVTEIFVDFDEAIDPGAVDSGAFTLTNLGPDAIPGGGDDSSVALASVVTSGSIRAIVTPTTAPLPDGIYQLDVAAGAVADNFGNNLTVPATIIFGATAIPAPGSVAWSALGGGDWHDIANWAGEVLPGNSDNVSIIVPNSTPDITMSSSATVIDLTMNANLSMTTGTLDVRGTGVINGDVTLSGSFGDPKLSVTGATASLLLNGAINLSNATLEARNGAVLTTPALVTVMDGFLSATGSSSIVATNLTSFTSGKITMSGATASLNAPLLSDVNNTSFLLNSSAALNLSSVTSYNLTQKGDFGSAFIFCSVSSGAQLQFPSLLTLETNVSASSPVTMTAISSATISMPALTTMTLNGTAVTINSSSSSIVDISALTAFPDRVNLTIGSGTVNAGELVSADNTIVNITGSTATFTAPKLASFTGAGAITLSTGASISLPGITGLDGIRVQIGGASTLTLANIAAFTGELLSVRGLNSALVAPLLTNLDDAEITGSINDSFMQFTGVSSYSQTRALFAAFQIFGVNSLLDLSGITSMSVSIGPTTIRMQATGGATLDLSSLTSITNATTELEFIADGANSTIDLSLLTAGGYDENQVTFTETNGGTIIR